MKFRARPGLAQREGDLVAVSERGRRRCAAPERASCVFADRSGDSVKQDTTLPAVVTFDERDLISDRVIVLWDQENCLVGPK